MAEKTATDRDCYNPKCPRRQQPNDILCADCRSLTRRKESEHQLSVTPLALPFLTAEHDSTFYSLEKLSGFLGVSVATVRDTCSHLEIRIRKRNNPFTYDGHIFEVAQGSAIRLANEIAQRKPKATKKIVGDARPAENLVTQQTPPQSLEGWCSSAEAKTLSGLGDGTLIAYGKERNCYSTSLVANRRYYHIGELTAFVQAALRGEVAVHPITLGQLKENNKQEAESM